MLIDAHLHPIPQDGFAIQQIHIMDKLGIQCGLLLGSIEDFVFMGNSCGGNEAVRKAVREFPDRFIGGVILDPRRHDALDTVHRYADAGFKAAKFYPPLGYHIDDPQFFPLFDEIQRLGWPATVHCGLTNMPYAVGNYRTTSSQFSKPVYLDGIIRLFPKINWIIAHMGWPDFDLVWGLVQFNDNVYMDISGPHAQIQGLDKIQREGFGFTCGVNLFDKMIWGSDTIAIEHYFQRTQQRLKEMGQEKHIANIFGTTAAKLLGIKG